MSFECEDKPEDFGRELWLVCDVDGYVLMGGETAKTVGISGGGFSVFELVRESERATLEGYMRANAEEEISVMFEPKRGLGYEVGNIRSISFFDTPAYEVSLFATRAEYVERTAEYGDVGKVCASDGRFSTIAKDVFAYLDENVDSERGLYDLSAVFDLIVRKFVEREGRLFGAVFENVAEGIPLIAETDARVFAGIVLLAGAIASRLSEERACRISLSADTMSAQLDIKAKLHKDYCFLGSGDSFMRLYGISRTKPSELLLLLRLASNPELVTSYEIDINGNFRMSVSVPYTTDSDRLKYRNAVSDVDGMICEIFDCLL